MRRIVVSAVAVAAAVTAAQAAGPHHNPMIDLLAKNQPVFGLYAPSNGRRSGGPQKTPDELAQAALAIPTSDFTFDGSMEGSVERGLPGFSAYALALSANGLIAKTPSPL